MSLVFTSKKAIIEKLRAQIEVKDSTAIHALMFIYDNQTIDEQAHSAVTYYNGVGFKPHDVKSGSSFAKWYKEKGFFTEKQITCVKRMIAKYAGQIVDCKIRAGEIKQVKRGEWIWG